MISGDATPQSALDKYDRGHVAELESKFAHYRTLYKQLYFTD